MKIQHPGVELTEGLDDVPMKDASPEPDLWLLRDDESAQQPEYRTWDRFELRKASLEPPTFITEAGASAYDALLASKDNPFRVASHDAYKVINPGGYLACLLALSLGRASVLFSWKPEKKTFVPALDHMKVPGYSGESLSGMLRLCTSSGEACRRLASFVNETYSSNASPSRVALANALDRLLLAIQDELGVRGLRTKSILQLQSLVRPVFILLSYFVRLVSRIKRSTTDSALLSYIYRESSELSEPLLRNMMSEILRMVSKPWLEFVASWIGLQREVGVPISKDGEGKGFIRVDSNVWIDDQGYELAEPDYFLDMDHMPTFVPDDIAQAIFETGRNIRFLRSYHPQHPLASMDAIDEASPPEIEWQYDWEAVRRVEQSAVAFQNAVSEGLRRVRGAGQVLPKEAQAGPKSSNSSVLQFFGKDEFRLEESVMASIAHLDQPIQETHYQDKFSRMLKERLFNAHGQKDDDRTEFSPHWSLIPLLSFGPPIYAQSRLVNRECLRLLYVEHGLREHLRLQRAFQLLGDGMFSSRLSNALFSPDMDTTERRAGTARSGGAMGLRLASRENWPPASSELRLALMGTLTESYRQDARASGSKDELPGDLSFSIRDLSPEEMERCMNPDSLEALDFLRMSYKPPSPLLPIMTPGILLKYDRIFKLMLRVLRLLFVVDQLFRDISSAASRWAQPDDASLRFRIEAHHFVSTVARYFFDTGIDKPWRIFESWLDKVEQGLDDSDAGIRATAISPDRLGEQHERTLDDIMTSLLLRKRQQPVLGLLEEIFSLILRFAKIARLRAEGVQDSGPHETGSLYKAFRAKVEIFITVVRGMTEKAGYGQKREGRASENSLVMLLLLLDMSNYYVR